jgi:tubulin-folding cofactor B
LNPPGIAARFIKMTTAHDIPLLITSANASSERRISPAWTIAHLKDRLEPITGIPSSAQRLRLGGKLLEVQDEENTQLSSFAPQPYSDLEVGTSFVF